MAVDRLKSVSSSLTGLLRKAGVLLPPRWVFLLVGLGCAGYSQFLMEERSPQAQHSTTAEFWNVVYRLEVINYDNVYYALPYFFAALLIFAWAAYPAVWKGEHRNWSPNWSPTSTIKSKAHLSRLLAGAGIFAVLLILLGRHQYQPIFPLLWLICLFLFTFSLWKWEKEAGTNFSLGASPTDIFWILILLVFGFAISSFALQDIPVIIVPDEGTFWEIARSIALGDFHPVFFDSGVYTFPVASSIFQGWVLKIFGVRFWSWRFSSVIAGVFAIIPLYLLAKNWFDRPTAIAAGIMMAANPYFISFARMGYNNSQSLFPVTLCVLLFALGARNGSYLYLWLAGLAAGIGFYSYSAAWIGIVTLCLGILYLHIRKDVDWKRALVTLAVILLAWAAVFAPRLAYTTSGENSGGLIYKIFETSFVNTFYAKAYYGEADLSHTIPLFSQGGQETAFYDPVIYGELLLRGTVRTILAIFNPFIVYEHFLVTGLTGVITPVFFLIGLGISLGYRKQLRFGLPLIWLTGGLIFLSIIGAFPPRHTHLVSVIPVLALISGVGLTAASHSLIETILSRWSFLRSLVRNVLITLTLAAIVFFGFRRYFVKMPLTYPPLFEDVASWIAWRTEKPVNLLYLGETEKPHRVEYLVNSHVAPHQYKSSTIAEFSSHPELESGAPTIIFVDSRGADELSIVQNPPAGFEQVVLFKHRDGYVIGSAMTNADINLNPKTGMEEGLHSLTGEPVRYVLLLLFILIPAFGALALQDAVGWPREELLIEIGQDPSKQAQIQASESGERAEFKFYLRLRIPPHRRRMP